MIINRKEIISRITKDIKFPSENTIETLMKILQNSRSPEQALNDISDLFENDEDFIVSLYFVGFAVRHSLGEN